MSSKIEWCDETWNPVVGCSKVSAGCDNCYAEKMAYRLSCMGQPAYMSTPENPGGVVFGEGCWSTGPSYGQWTGRTALNSVKHFELPFSWKKPRRIFVCSMGDLFHESVPVEWIYKVLTVVAMLPRHTFMFLTKRPERMCEIITDLGRGGQPHLPHVSYPQFGNSETESHISNMLSLRLEREGYHVGWPMRNLWVGTSVEDQKTADARIPSLLRTQAAARFVSVEPMLGAVDLTEIDTGKTWPFKGETSKINALRGHASSINKEPSSTAASVRFIDLMNTGKLDWVICGGESGPKARALNQDSVRGLRDQCSAAGVPFMFKQWGEWAPFGQAGIVKAHGLEPSNNKFRVYFETGLPRDCIREHPHVGVYKIGKKKAGRLLDGKEHLAFPGEGEFGGKSEIRNMKDERDGLKDLECTGCDNPFPLYGVPGMPCPICGGSLEVMEGL